jgi:hypothetical protein
MATSISGYMNPRSVKTLDVSPESINQAVTATIYTPDPGKTIF